MTLIGKLSEDSVIFEEPAMEELHNRSFYGRPKGDRLEVSLAESAYLIYLGKIRVEYKGTYLDFKAFFLKASSILKNFELYYIVYRDLRERGYFVQPAVTGFRVYPRGGHPGKTPAEFFIYVTSERIPLLLSVIIMHLGTAENLKKRLVLAIVDEDSDLTYYEVKKTVPAGTFQLGSDKIISKASLLEDRVMVWDPVASTALQRWGFFGNPMDEGHLQLSLVESCFLLKNGILEIEDRDKRKLDFIDFLAKASMIESDFTVKYAIYENLRNNRLVPKTGFKFGTHFRVYKKIEDMAKLPHSDYLIHAIEKDHIFSLQQLSRSVRLANSVRKDMIYGAAYSHIQFFVIGRMRL